MNWKTDLRLSDVDQIQLVEIVCKKCGLTRIALQHELVAANPDLFKLYFDEVEMRLRCADRFCHGEVRVSLLWDHKLEGWVGGMA